MKWICLSFCALLAGCTCENKKQADETDSAIPRVAFSAQPRVRGEQFGATSATPPPATSAFPDRERATRAGYDLHDSATKGCTDQKCTGGNCGKLCTQWMDETIKTFSSVNAKNDTYFNCFGACLAGRHDN